MGPTRLLQGRQRTALSANILRLLVGCTLIAGLVLRLKRAWADVPTIILEATPDDAFYYFGIARNIATGHNVTFDGEHLTNGFHPLWAALLTPFYLVTDSSELPIHLGLSMSAVFDVGTILLIFLIVRALTEDEWSALLSSFVYAVHPYFVVQAVNGLETGVSVFMVAIITWLFVRLALRQTPPSGCEYVVLGIAGGCAVLARTDTILILIPVVLYLMIRARGPGLGAGVVVAGSGLLVVLPWLIWSLVSFGTVIQVSGIAVPDVERQVFLAANGDSFITQLEQAWDVTHTALLVDLPNLYLVPNSASRVPLLATGGALLCFMLVAPLSPRRSTFRALAVLALPLAGVLAALLFHSAIRWHLRPWYFGPMGLFGTIALGITLAYVAAVVRNTRFAGLLSRLKPVGSTEEINTPLAISQPVDMSLSRSSMVAGVYLLAFVAILSVLAVRTNQWIDPLPHRVNQLEAAEWLEANTSEGARIGSFNAGIVGYFSERTVINLDGAVNNKAYEARRERLLLGYICDEKIEYLVDLKLDLWIGMSCPDQPTLRFERVATVGVLLGYFGGGQVAILRLSPTP